MTTVEAPTAYSDLLRSQIRNEFKEVGDSGHSSGPDAAGGNL